MAHSETLEVRILLPFDNKMLTVQLSDDLTAHDVVAELIAAQALAENKTGYSIAVKGGDFIDPRTTLRNAKLPNQALLRIVPHTDAG